VSAYRDSLPDDGTRARYDDACARAGRVLAQARYERDMLAASSSRLHCGWLLVVEGELLRA
jgi:hypothetical protein